MYHDSKVQVCVGLCSGLLTWISALSFTQDIVPIISYVGICAGTFVALHGMCTIIKNWYVKLKEKNHYDTWY